MVPLDEEPEPEVEEVAEPEPEPVAAVEDRVGVTTPVITVMPQMLDRERMEALLQDAYPMYLQRAGIGGVVGLRLWIDTNGLAGIANVASSSNVRELDRAALQVTPLFRFSPARQGGAPVATWIDFPVTFEPDPDSVEPLIEFRSDNPMRLPILHPDDVWEFEEPLDLASLPTWAPEPVEVLSTVEEELADALGDPIVRRSLGPIESVLTGIAPEGRDPIEWRASASAILEAAVERDLANPAPLLALGRIRLRQGLRTDARLLFEQGLQMAVVAVSDASPEVVAELHYERGRLIRERWLGSRDVGRVRASAFEMAPCEEAGTSSSVALGFASVERLMAWNYLCPAQLTQVFETGFEPREDNGETDLSLMMGLLPGGAREGPGAHGCERGLPRGAGRGRALDGRPARCAALRTSQRRASVGATARRARAAEAG